MAHVLQFGCPYLHFMAERSRSVYALDIAKRSLHAHNIGLVVDDGDNGSL